MLHPQRTTPFPPAATSTTTTPEPFLSRLELQGGLRTSSERPCLHLHLLLRLCVRNLKHTVQLIFPVPIPAHAPSNPSFVVVSPVRITVPRYILRRVRGRSGPRCTTGWVDLETRAELDACVLAGFGLGLGCCCCFGCGGKVGGYLDVDARVGEGAVEMWWASWCFHS